MADIGTVGGPPQPDPGPAKPGSDAAAGFDALLRQLGLSVLLVDLHARAAARQPDDGDLMASLVADHWAHAAELTRLIAAEVAADQRSGLREVVEHARVAAASACLAAPLERPGHIEVLGMIAASLAGHGMVLDLATIGQ
jgi:hypothetical protein